MSDGEAREKLLSTAEELLTDSGKISAMEQAALRLGKKNAADDIACEVLKLCGESAAR